MKNFSISKERAVGFYAEAEALGIATKAHHTECISREHTCPTQKDVYLTYEKAAKALRMRSNRERCKEVYKCHICGHFHLTSKDGEGRRPRAYSSLNMLLVFYLLHPCLSSGNDRRYGICRPPCTFLCLIAF